MCWWKQVECCGSQTLWLRRLLRSAGRLHPSTGYHTAQEDKTVSTVSTECQTKSNQHWVLNETNGATRKSVQDMTRQAAHTYGRRNITRLWTDHWVLVDEWKEQRDKWYYMKECTRRDKTNKSYTWEKKYHLVLDRPLSSCGRMKRATYCACTLI